MPEVALLYTGLLAIAFAVLSTLVSIRRGQTNIPLGHGQDRRLELAVRRFGNLSEYGPMACLVLVLLEMSGTSSGWLHAYGIALVGFRSLHPVSLFCDPDSPLWMKSARFVSAAGTAALLLAGGIALVAT
ncbi:MAG: MAPEG family protein [Polyangiaceae bacterium]